MANPWYAPGMWGGGALPWLPGADWSQTPWAGYVQEDPQRASQMQGWFNTFFPWLQAYQQGQQWQQSFDWQKVADEWAQQFQMGQFDWQKAQDLWSQQFQEAQQAWTKEQDIWARGLQEQQLKQQEEAATMAAFGRRWRPSTRWM